MAQFVLVHGSFHGPWCWDKFAPLLRAAGHSVVTPNLADAGTNSAYPDLHDYALHIAGIVNQLEGKVFLVGHSMGGLVVTQAAELVADKLAALVYVSGLLLRHGETLQSFLASHAELGVDDLVLANMKISEDGQLATFPVEAAPGVFCNRCTIEDATWAAHQLRAQPTAVYGTPISVTHEKFGVVPRYYVICEDDKAVSIAYQRQMLANTHCAEIFSLSADHSPFFSDAEGLFACFNNVLISAS